MARRPVNLSVTLSAVSVGPVNNEQSGTDEAVRLVYDVYRRNFVRSTLSITSRGLIYATSGLELEQDFDIGGSWAVFYA